MAALYFGDLIYSLNEPLGIQGETSAGRRFLGNMSLLRPMNGRMFGCRICRQTSASRQSLWLQRSVKPREERRSVRYLKCYGVPTDSSELLHSHGLARENSRMHVCKATTQRATIWLKSHLPYEQRYRKLLATVRKLDEKMDGAASSRVVLGNDMKILSHGISSYVSPPLTFAHHLDSL
jgi:hypothetical protein